LAEVFVVGAATVEAFDDGAGVDDAASEVGVADGVDLGVDEGVETMVLEGVGVSVELSGVLDGVGVSLEEGVGVSVVLTPVPTADCLLS